MKIGIDVRPLMAKNYSGVAFYTLNLLKAMFEIDKKNEYLLFYNSSAEVDLPKFNQSNVRYVGFNYPNKLLNFSFKVFNWPKIDKLIGGVDVLFVPNINFLSLSDKVSSIIVVHDLSFIRFPQFFPWKMRLWHKLLYRQFGRADALIAVSENTAKDVRELLPVEADKVSVVYEGVEEKFKVLADNDSQLELVRKKYNLPAKFILYLGTLEPRKNIDSIILAHNQLNTQCDLVIAGGKGWKVKMGPSVTDSHSKIKFIGYVDEADKVALYNLATIFVFPSYYEGFGLPLLEAMACGTPVISGANSSQVEVVADAGLLVNPYNVSEISEAMRLLLADDGLRQKLILAGLVRAKSFNWRDSATKIINRFNVI